MTTCSNCGNEYIGGICRICDYSINLGVKLGEKNECEDNLLEWKNFYNTIVNNGLLGPQSYIAESVMRKIKHYEERLEEMKK